MRKICFKKTKHTLKTFEYLKRCKQCESLFASSAPENLCINCNRIIIFYTNCNIAIFTIRDVIQASFKKRNLTFYDFEVIEKKMLEKSNKNIFFTYSPETMTWYITIPHQTNESESNCIIETLLRMIEILTNALNLSNKNILQQIQKEIASLFLYHDNVHMKKSNLLNVLNIFDLSCTNKLSLLLTNRNIIQKKINQSFDFFSNY